MTNIHNDFITEICIPLPNLLQRELTLGIVIGFVICFVFFSFLILNNLRMEHMEEN